MAVWIETQVEFVVDAIDEIILKHGETNVLKELRKKIVEAWTNVTDLSDDDVDLKNEMLTNSHKILFDVEKVVLIHRENATVEQDRDWRIFHNKVKNACREIEKMIQ